MTKQETAFKAWQAGLKYKDISDKYGISLNTIKSWARRNWKESKKNYNSKAQPQKKRGAPKGNKNARGNLGGAPKGSKNNFKHGLYEKFLYRDLQEDEKDFFLNKQVNLEDELKMIIKLSDIQISCFLQKINEIEKAQKALDKIFKEKAKKKTRSLEEIILKFSAEISRIQATKIRGLNLLLEISHDTSAKSKKSEPLAKESEPLAKESEPLTKKLPQATQRQKPTNPKIFIYKI